MKPTKNKVYCIGCKRSKMLFSEERNALNFIKFNSESIADRAGRAPVRAYYCPYCLGWHVTSNESEEVGQRLDQKDKVNTERAMQARALDLELESLGDLIKPRLYRAVALGLLGHEEKSRVAFGECNEWIQLMKDKAPFSKVPVRLMDHFRQMHKLTERILVGLLQSPDVRRSRGENPNCKDSSRKVYQNVTLVERMRVVISEAPPAVLAEPKLLNKRLSPHVQLLVGDYSAEIKSAIFAVVEELYSRDGMV